MRIEDEQKPYVHNQPFINQPSHEDKRPSDISPHVASGEGESNPTLNGIGRRWIQAQICIDVHDFVEFRWVYSLLAPWHLPTSILLSTPSKLSLSRQQTPHTVSIAGFIPAQQRLRAGAQGGWKTWQAHAAFLVIKHTASESLYPIFSLRAPGLQKWWEILSWRTLTFQFLIWVLMWVVSVQ